MPLPATVVFVTGLPVTSDRKSVVEGKRGDLGGRRIIKKKAPESVAESLRLLPVAPSSTSAPALVLRAGLRGPTTTFSLVPLLPCGGGLLLGSREWWSAVW